MLTPAQRELQTAVHQGRKRGDLWCGLGEALAKGSSSIRFNTSHFHYLSRSGCVGDRACVTVAWRKELGHFFARRLNELQRRCWIVSWWLQGRTFCQDFHTHDNNWLVSWKMASASSIAASIASKTKTKKKHFVAQKVKLFRASDPLLSVVMWGVNHSVSHIFSVSVMTRESKLMSPSSFWCPTLFEVSCRPRDWLTNRRWQLSSYWLYSHQRCMTPVHKCFDRSHMCCFF